MLGDLLYFNCMIEVMTELYSKEKATEDNDNKEEKSTSETKMEENNTSTGGKIDFLSAIKT